MGSKDNWSLKDRYISVPDDFISYSLIKTGKEKLYKKETINILREKLIEDMEYAWSKLCGKDDKMKYAFIDAWRNSINKRFGVE